MVTGSHSQPKGLSIRSALQLDVLINRQAGDVVMVIPARAIHSLHTIPEVIACKLHPPPNVSLHGLLTAELALHHIIALVPYAFLSSTTSKEALLAFHAVK